MTWLSGPMLGPGPADDAAVLAELEALRALDESGQSLRAVIDIGPFTAFALIATLQLTYRHPHLGANTKRLIKEITGPLEGMFSGLLGEVLEEGWDPARDVVLPDLIDKR